MSSFRVVGNNCLCHGTSHPLKVLKYSVEVKFVIENAIASRRTSEFHTLYSHQNGSFDPILSRPPLLVLTTQNVGAVLYPFHGFFWMRGESNQDGTTGLATGKETGTGVGTATGRRELGARVLRERG